MTQTLDTLVNLLTLERIEENLFRGASQDLGFPQLFGGQVLGQVISAASQTVDAARHVHSLHGYFLRPGDSHQPVVYDVDRVRDGGSFSTRRVSAIQKGQTIFTGIASFQADENGYEHQLAMPDVAGPDELPSEWDLLHKLSPLVPERVMEKLRRPKPIEIRPVTVQDPANPQPIEPVRHLWFRADGTLPANPALHKYLLAYASDFSFIGTALQPHGVSSWSKFIQLASLDHAIWFHREVKIDDWLLYSIDSPWAGNARGFARGSIFNRQGQLVASVAQEGLIRVREDWM
ncbi:MULTISPECIES: acyl-CoA thioesterase II [Stutzerimonas stutzeri group]|uniref:acyl-CoA thioesterase II n=1 Tax=Stutzerimonas stutzeri group TaxID=136846 RepID=UPI0012D91CE7|nr:MULTISPECIES: acyl-CoA thioesterase II [Stutzerimonas stutzeri group]MCF6751239.1 acyl-CoA thioesterase II [Stutzerimonas stutzeri]MTZ12954.1 acyl-CoA thioesterase II [Stutzerimonas degradans]NHC08788.1 acyl-CoA thioesterase II [Stutzerimonas degradans]NHW01027.1 acyl-CoA thioesterase II [Stutzerimonas degradans]UVO17556.1 acyl-CoA thioesterase II [Stutzerimonas stutzeri]